jgi:adenylosuccinate synthase
MNAHIVVGLGFGDEGKGVTTSSLVASLDKPIVVRFNGGHQAGHTVIHNGIRHVFSNFGSGTLQGVPTIWSKYCTFDPVGVYNEYKALKALGVTPKLYVDPDCPVVTAYDKHANVEDPFNLKHGTCGVGFGKTLQRHENFYKIHVRDLFYPWIFEEKLIQTHRYYGSAEGEFMIGTMYAAKKVVQEGMFELINYDLLEEGNYENIIFEGAQGILLDQDYGFFPHVTRSNTTGKNALQFIQDEFGYLYITTYYVTRAYQTRHGNGPMSNQNIPLTLKNNEKETNVEGVQGKFRTAPLDLDVLRYSLSCNKQFEGSSSKLIITCLDQIDGDIPITEREYYSHTLPDKLATMLGFEDILTFDSPETKKLF